MPTSCPALLPMTESKHCSSSNACSALNQGQHQNQTLILHCLPALHTWVGAC